MRLFERERNLCFDILAAHDKASATATGPTAAEQTLEEITESALTPASAKQVAKVTKSSLRPFPLRRRPKVLSCFPVRPELVVALAFVGIRQNLIGFVYLFKFLFGGFISGIDVRVILARQLAVRCFDRALSGGFRNAEYFIVISKLYRRLY